MSKGELKQFVAVVKGGTTYSAERAARKRADNAGLTDWVIVRVRSQHRDGDDGPMTRTYFFAPTSVAAVMFEGLEEDGNVN